VYGLFSLGLIIVSFVATFASLGLNDGLIRYIPYYLGKNEKSKIKYTVLLTIKILSFTGIIFGIITFLLSNYLSLLIVHDSSLTIYLQIMSISIPFLLLSNLFLSVLRSYERTITYSFFVNIFQNVLKLLLLLILIMIGLKDSSIPWSYTLSIAGLAIGSYFASMKLIGTLLKESKKITKSNELRNNLLSYSWPLIFVGLLYGLFYWSDSLILGYLTDATQVGFYNVAITLVGLFGIAPDLFMQLFLPLISNKLSQNKKGLVKELSRQISKWIYLINLPILCIVLLFPGVIINFFFGSQFLIASKPLMILAGGAIFSGFISLFTGLLTSKGKTKLILVDFLCAALINIILDIVLITKYGMVGAAIATVTSWIIFFTILLIQVKSNYGFIPLRMIMIRISIVTAILIYLIILLQDKIIPSTPNIIWISLFINNNAFRMSRQKRLGNNKEN
jgi:O-antigen/teichoic acid export membrane protein